jgi:hypothetical protein
MVDVAWESGDVITDVWLSHIPYLRH